MFAEKKSVATKVRIRIVWRFLLVFTLFSIIILAYVTYGSRHQNAGITILLPRDNHSEIINEFYSMRKMLKLSRLGEVLFLNTSIPSKRDEIFKILIWKHGEFLKNRHIFWFSNQERDPFENCMVDNCVMTYEDKDLDSSDAVVVHLHRTPNLESLPVPTPRRAEQRWILLTDESPYGTFINKSWKTDWRIFTGIFNWSMTYKMESDVPVPYGRTVGYNKPQNTENIMDMVPNGNTKRRDVLAAVLISDCGGTNKRLWYIRELEKHMTLDVYGRCGKKLINACPGHYKADCPLINNYLFYLAFENSNCDEYLTEKVFWNGYSKGAVPIVMGASRESYKSVLPPNSYIHVRDYPKPKDLAKHLEWLNKTWDANFFKYHSWRQHFAVENEHGYFNSKSIHYCRICEALNFNDVEKKTYDDLSNFLSSEKNCYT